MLFAGAYDSTVEISLQHLIGKFAWFVKSYDGDEKFGEIESSAMLGRK